MATMKSVEAILLENIDKPNSCFIFPTEVSASRWADHLLRLRGGTVAMKKFIAWDVFKQNSIKSKVQNKKSIPSVLRKIFVSRLVRENAEVCKAGKEPILSSLIRTQWADQAAQFIPWLAGILPQLGVWFKKTIGLAIDTILSEQTAKAAFGIEDDGTDRDLFVLAQRYAQFLDEYGLFEPAWETPPFNDEGQECFIFFVQSLSDYSEYRELLETSNHVKTINASNTETLPCDNFFYTNSRSEITEAALYIRALHEKQNINWDTIVVSIPDSQNYEPYVLRELVNRNIPFVKRSSKPLAGYPAGRFFSSVIDCTSRGFAFPALVSLVLNRNLPWKDTVQIHNLVEFGIKNNCISSWTETKDGKEETINVWEDAFNQPFGGIDPDTRRFFLDLKKRLYALRTAESFSEVRRQYFIFREYFFDMDKCTEETDQILSRCISELIYLGEIEKDYPDVLRYSPLKKPAVDPFLFFTEYLEEINYLAQTKASGVTILPYRTAATAPFDCHIILGAGQDCLSVIFTRLDFLPRKKREELGIFDEDSSTAFIDLHKFNSHKHSAFFCSEQTFTGFAIPHSKNDMPVSPMNRYAATTKMQDKFSHDYYSITGSLDNSTPVKLHENQIEGFNRWKARRKHGSAGEKWHTDEKLLELIRKKYAYEPEYHGKYGVSASSLAPYHKCSLKWLFERVLVLENEKIEASLMAENITGIVYHAIINLFFTELKRKDNTLPRPNYSHNFLSLPENYHKLLEQSVNTIFTGFPLLQADGKLQMSALTARLLRAGKRHIQFNLEKCLAHFLSLFHGYYIAGSEISYKAERGQYFLNGKLDCILSLDKLKLPWDSNCNDPGNTKKSEGQYIIIDFKLKHLPERGDCTGEEDRLSDFQLPMYITLAEENDKIKINTALFYSILNLEPEVIVGTVDDEYSAVTIPKKEDKHILRDSELYNQIVNEFNQKAEQFAGEISTGNFTVFESEFNECKNCDYKRICRTGYIINRAEYITARKA